MWWFWWLEDELVVVGGGNVALGGGAEGGEGVARERHGPAQAATGGDGTGQRHNAPGYAGVKAQLLALHHIEGAIERHDNLAFVVESITGRGLAMRLAIRSRRGLFLGRMPATATAAGAGLRAVASTRFPGVGADIVRHGNSHRLGEQLGCRKLLGRIDVFEAERGAGGLDNLGLIQIAGMHPVDQAADALTIAGEQFASHRRTGIATPDSTERLNPPLLAWHAYVEQNPFDPIGKRADQFW